MNAIVAISNLLVAAVLIPFLDTSVGFWLFQLNVLGALVNGTIAHIARHNRSKITEQI